MKTSLKTTIAGVLTIITALSSAGLTYVNTGALPDFAVLIAAITSGVGLILARDNSVSSETAGAK
jgi:hypothetical protein